jgi:hypothetical protein
VWLGDSFLRGKYIVHDVAGKKVGFTNSKEPIAYPYLKPGYIVLIVLLVVGCACLCVCGSLLVCLLVKKVRR